MKKEIEPINNCNYVMAIGITAFIMSQCACTAIKKIGHNMDSNYRAKNGLEQLPKKEDKKPAIAKF